MKCTDEMVEAACKAYARRDGWTWTSAEEYPLAFAAMRAAIEALPEALPGPVPDRDFLAKQLEDAWRHGPKATVECWHGVAARAEELCAGKLPAEVFALVESWRGLAHTDAYARGGGQLLLEVCSDELEAVLKSAPKPNMDIDYREQHKRERAEWTDCAQRMATQIRNLEKKCKRLEDERGRANCERDKARAEIEREKTEHAYWKASADDKRAQIDRLRAELRDTNAELVATVREYEQNEEFQSLCEQQRAELEKTRAELEACERNRDLFREHQLRAEAECSRVGLELVAIRGQHEALRTACELLVACADGADHHGAERALVKLRALLKPAPSAWQHISSDGDSHTFRHSSGAVRVVEGFDLWAEAERHLDEPAPAEAEPEMSVRVQRFTDPSGEPRYRTVEPVQHPPPESAMVEQPPPGLRPLPEGWTYANEADALRPNDRHALKPVQVPASLQPLWERFHVLREFVVQASRGNTIAGATTALDRFDRIERAALDARKARS